MIKIILTDIEGTISSISFVKDVLFPYARKNIADYLKTHANDLEVKQIVTDVVKICGRKMVEQEIIDTLIQWIDEDKKITPLKVLQGLIWEDGFKKNVFKAHIYPDALEKLQYWKSKGLPIYVYSSGSIFAQKLFFTYNSAGDILPVFSGHYDTVIGGKKDSASYTKIAEDIQVQPSEILFLSDIVEELDAASDAGMKTKLILRDNQIVHQSRHKVYSDFTGIEIN
ncbi:MAG: acireductone synthase [Spirochaetia bacterium]|nr:acireductone synthase [Spirochaetia bacterium]